jgi:L-alanine-DL-glutamate epimerase-like enolase superfamily enzyme
MVDVNGMWGPSDVIRALNRVREIGLELLEQPLPVDAEPFQRALVARLDLDIAADGRQRDRDGHRHRHGPPPCDCAPDLTAPRGANRPTHAMRRR